jgi:microcin C transport system ATP-binding protein
MHWIPAVAETSSRPIEVSATDPLLQVEQLSVSFGSAQAPIRVLDQVSFSVSRGEKLALVGESGSGKTMTALAILRLIADAQVQGRITLAGQSIAEASDRQMRALRGRRVAMIFQEPMSALNPLFSIGDQIVEPLSLHLGLSRPAARARAIELLDLTGIPEPSRRVDSYPHELSGGQRQRAMIAMALACEPELLIADEPTTALDVTIQRQIIELLDDLQRRIGMAVLLISHDLPLVRRFADRVGVMSQGKLLELQPTEALFSQPRHDYTRRLIDSRPRRQVGALDPQAPVLLEAEGAGCRYWIRRGWFGRRPFDAARDVDLVLRRGETLGIVGESGSGKTTLGMTLLRLASGDPMGRIRFEGQSIESETQAGLRPLRRQMQVVFQDPYNALSPRMTVEQIVGEGLRLHRPELGGPERRALIADTLTEVGLDTRALLRYPHEFSGGQRQRIAIARAVILRPRLLLLDEPTSALDVSVQQQVLALLTELQQRHGLSYLFITHDLAVIRAMAHRVLVMKDGRVVESAQTATLFESPQAAYTRELLDAFLG